MGIERVRNGYKKVIKKKSCNQRERKRKTNEEQKKKENKTKQEAQKQKNGGCSMFSRPV